MLKCIGDNAGRSIALRSLAMLLALALMAMPQALNSRSLILLMDEYGTAPAPMAEEEEVKHACTISWCTILYATKDHLWDRCGTPPKEDPFGKVDHGEVDVPPPKN